MWQDAAYFLGELAAKRPCRSLGRLAGSCVTTYLPRNLCGDLRVRSCSFQESSAGMMIRKVTNSQQFVSVPLPFVTSVDYILFRLNVVGPGKRHTDSFRQE